MSDTGQQPVLARDAVFLGRSTEPMEAAIDFVGGELVRRGLATAPYIDGMKDREKSASTYLGNGVALPHGTFESKDSILGTGIVVAQYPDGVDWGPGVAHLVIGLAASGDEHVQVLAQLAEVLQDEDLCERLRATDDIDFVHRTLSGADAPVEGELSAEVEILNPAGLHARPASQIVERAKNLVSTITIHKDGKSADARSIMSVLALGATTGDRVTVTAVGDDAEQAIEAITAVMVSREEP
ncbi:MAG: HPr family phosphocarrier protein [Actinomycetes bacterium]